MAAKKSSKERIYKVLVYPPRDPLTGKPIQDVETELYLKGTNASFVETEIDVLFQIMNGRTIIFSIPTSLFIYCADVNSLVEKPVALGPGLKVVNMEEFNQ